MKRPFQFVTAALFLAASLSTLTGCANLTTLSRAHAIDREVRMDRLNFCERMKDAYFLLGYEYYTLAKEAEDRKDLRRANEYAQKSKSYSLVSKDFKQTAEQMRQEMQPETAPLPEVPAQAPEAAAPVNAAQPNMGRMP